MNRRSFLALFASSAAAVGLGVVPLVAESGRTYSVRFIEAFDIMQGKLVHRIDISNFPLEISKGGIDRAMAFHSVPSGRLLDAIDLMRIKVPEIPERQVISAVMGDQLDSDPLSIFGIRWD